MKKDKTIATKTGAHGSTVRVSVVNGHKTLRIDYKGGAIKKFRTLFEFEKQNGLTVITTDDLKRIIEFIYDSVPPTAKELAESDAAAARREAEHKRVAKLLRTKIEKSLSKLVKEIPELSKGKKKVSVKVSRVPCEESATR